MGLYYKVTRDDGTDFRTGKYSYIPTGAPLVEPHAMTLPKRGKVNDSCGPGLHLSPTVRQAIYFAERSFRNWRYFECEVADDDIIAYDARKIRARQVTPLREMPLAEVLGYDLAARVESVRPEIDSWSKIPWLKPPAAVTKEQVEKLLAEWHDAMAPWAEKRGVLGKMPRRARIVTDRAAAAAAAAVADADAAAAADAAAVADAAAAAAADAAAVANAAAVADAVAADAVAAVAADAAAAAGLYRLWPYWLRWYVTPRYTMLRLARWDMFMTGPNPWRPIVELFRLGCVAIGYARMPGETEAAFVVYVPPVAT